MSNLYSIQCDDNHIKDMKCNRPNVTWHRMNACPCTLVYINTGTINFVSARNIKLTLWLVAKHFSIIVVRWMSNVCIFTFHMPKMFKLFVLQCLHSPAVPDCLGAKVSWVRSVYQPRVVYWVCSTSLSFVFEIWCYQFQCVSPSDRADLKLSYFAQISVAKSTGLIYF